MNTNNTISVTGEISVNQFVKFIMNALEIV